MKEQAAQIKYNGFPLTVVLVLLSAVLSGIIYFITGEVLDSISYRHPLGEYISDFFIVVVLAGPEIIYILLHLIHFKLTNLRYLAKGVAAVLILHSFFLVLHPIQRQVRQPHIPHLLFSRHRPNHSRHNNHSNHLTP